MTDDETRSDEISVLQSIYNSDELFVQKNDHIYSGSFQANVEITNKFLVIYKNLMNPEDELESLQVDYLPPICLNFDLPLNYPSISPPNYKLSCPWLSFKQLIYLSVRLDKLWRENCGTPVLFVWIDFLKNESLSSLQMYKFVDIRGIFTKDIQYRTRKSQYADSKYRKKEKVDVLELRKRARQERIDYNRDRKNWKSRTYSTFHDIKIETDKTHCALDNKKTEDCGPPVTIIPSRSSSERSTYDTKPEKSFFDLVKDKFGIECEKQKFYEELSFDVCRRQTVHIDKKRVDNILGLLVNYNEEKTISEFNKGFYTCDICYQSQLGSKCTEFKPCKHVYCTECIQNYFRVRINENTVQTMPCPHEECTSQASQNQIKVILGEELYRRYDKLLLNATLDMMSDVVYCPRRGCQLPVVVEPDRMAYCHSCSFAFCSLCLKTYHGVQPCAMKNEEKRKLAMKYEEGSSAEKSLLEARYGKQQLTTLVQTVLSCDWISEHSKECPSCKTSIEKSEGCNKMVCTKCWTMFCWLCHTVLDKVKPYKHFYDLKSKCYNRLFYGMTEESDDGDLEDDDIFMFGQEDDDMLDIAHENLHHDDFELIQQDHYHF